MMTSMMRVRPRSEKPPKKPAASPTITPITVANVDTVSPNNNELRMDQESSQKISWPRLLVPMMCCSVGGRLRK